ncbi:MAG: phosphomannomutase/phosphoglucomutase [bacterium]|nr:phosphomannomutase/phosphoglucomutase [bacterium]
MSNSKIEIVEELRYNSAEFFQKALIKPAGFREYDVRWLIDKELNYTGLTILGQAYGTYLQKEYSIEKIVVGHDFRKYSQNVKNAFVNGLLSSGMDVVDIGLCLSPTLYFAQYHLGIKGGAMITASHNENGWTGIKLCYDLSKTLVPDDIKKFKDIVYSGDFLTGKGTYALETSVQEEYIKDVASKADTGRKLKVVIATGNGTAGMYTPEIFRLAGHEVVEQHVEPDWEFPNFNPNPEDISFLKDIGQKVRDVNADLGIGIDGDGDRLGVVDENGEEIFSDKIGLLVARDIAPKHPGSKFIIDVKSTGLFKVDDIINSNDCEIIIWKTGHSYIKSKVHETGSIAGFEKSGHFFFNDPYGRKYDDGTLSSIIFANIISNQDKPVSHLLEALTKSYNSPTMAPYVDDNRKYDVVQQMVELYQKDKDSGTKIAGIAIEDLITVNGVRVQYEDKSWGLVRASSNKPSLVVVAESFTTRKRMYDIFEDIVSKLEIAGGTGDWDQKLPDYPGED